MSGPLLLGIAAVGVGWAWVSCRHTPTAAIAPGEPGLNTQLTPAAADDARTVGSEIPQAKDGATAVKDAVDGSSPAPRIGDNSPAGSDGGQVLPMELPVEGGLIIPSDQSTGGADPSTQKPTLSDNNPVDTPPIIVRGDDSAELVLQATNGIAGSNGMTEQQIARAFAESAVWSQEVF